MFFDIGLLFQRGPPLPDKDQSQQGPLLNDNTLRSQLVFTAEEEECIKASGLIVVVFSFTNWLGASKPLIQFTGRAAIWVTGAAGKRVVVVGWGGGSETAD